MGSKRGPNRIFDAEALEKPLESLLERSWTILERSWSALGALLDALIALLEQKTLQLSARRARIKPEQVVRPESKSCNHLSTSVQSSAYVL